jgi:uncharacterized protein YcbK (DUF882 family)
MIVRTEVLMGRDVVSPLNLELEINLKILLGALNMFRKAYGIPMNVSSGYRPPEINKTVKGAATHSNHRILLACDFHDADGHLYDFAKNNTKLLEDCGIWCEERQGNWLHMQVVPPKSGHRWFNP